MPKQKSIEDNELIRLLDEYRLNNPNIKVTIPAFGKYIRSRGYDVQDHTIRRRTGFHEYLETVNQGSEEVIYSDLVTYQTLDVDVFLSEHRTRESLKEALIVWDRYYARIAAHAAEAISARKKAEKRVQELEVHCSELEEHWSEVQRKAVNAEFKQKEQAIVKMKKLLDDYIYPDAANAILQREGILEVVSSVVPQEQVEKHMIGADTEMGPFEYDSVNSLLGDFDN